MFFFPFSFVSFSVETSFLELDEQIKFPTFNVTTFASFIFEYI